MDGLIYQLALPRWEGDEVQEEDGARTWIRFSSSTCSASSARRWSVCSPRRSSASRSLSTSVCQSSRMRMHAWSSCAREGGRRQRCARRAVGSARTTTTRRGGATHERVLGERVDLCRRLALLGLGVLEHLGLARELLVHLADPAAQLLWAADDLAAQLGDAELEARDVLGDLAPALHEGGHVGTDRLARLVELEGRRALGVERLDRRLLCGLLGAHDLGVGGSRGSAGKRGGESARRLGLEGWRRSGRATHLSSAIFSLRTSLSSMRAPSSWRSFSKSSSSGRRTRWPCSSVK